MRFLLFIIVCVSVVFMAESCKRECHDKSNPDCENYDPCYTSKKLTADFEVFESFQTRKNWIAYDTDTLYAINANFEAKEDNVLYEWKIGTETIYSKSVTRKNFPKYTSIPVTLTVRRIKNFDCFPNDSIASQTRTIIFVDNTTKLRVEGCFQGNNYNNPNDTFTVCIKLFDSLTFPDWKGKTTISGLITNSTCPNKTFRVTGQEDLGYQQYTFTTSHGDCLLPEGRVRVDSAYSGNIRIDYSYYTDIFDLNSKVNKTFIGKRLN